MEGIIEQFKKNADELFKNYKKQAVDNVNLGNSKKRVKLKDVTLFMQLFSIYSDKISKLADKYEDNNWTEDEKFKLNSLSKQYMLKYYELFNFNRK